MILNKNEIKKMKKIVKKIRIIENKYNDLSREEIINKLSFYKNNPNINLKKILPEVFALTVIASKRTLGMRHFDVQLIGGIVLHKGIIAEMKTGEGKTLVATCPVVLNALTGKGVHVITVNDYLARRDCNQMSEVFEYLGLSSGCIYQGMPFDERKKAYECDITYGTNNEFGFDYLKDNMAKTKGQIVQRSLNYVIIDEVDSILIDDSKTPLIISGGDSEASDIYYDIDKIVKKLIKTTNYNPDMTKIEKIIDEDFVPNGDYIVIEKTKEVLITDSGIKKIEEFFEIKNLASDENVMLYHYLIQSIKANYTMTNNVDYIVKENKIAIVDESTGRLMESRKFSDNLHQAIEAKEGLVISEENQTMATITYQNFFRMYSKMAGMTGTAITDKYEFKKIYNLKILQIPTNKPVLRIDYDDFLYSTKEEKYINIVNKIKEYYKKGRPILIGTPSIEESEIIHNLLLENNIKHNVLNAKNHMMEAEIIAQAGRLNSVTVATNMAGRGTDILLGGNPDFLIKKEKNRIYELNKEALIEDNIIDIETKIKEECKKEKELVLSSGGLAVIGVERFENRRVDNQLRGRAGRQGDTGSSEFFVSTEDKMFKMFNNVVKNKNLDFSNISKMNNKFIRNTQKNLENFNYSIRKNTLEYDDVNDSQRKQIYEMRKKILFMSDDEIMNIFYKYKNEVIHYLIKENINLSDFFKNSSNIETNFESISEYIDSVIEKNTKNLETHNNNIENMIRFVIISTIDRNWIRYLNLITSLKETVNITTMGSLKPIQLYKIESVKLFNNLICDIKNEIISSSSNMIIQPKMNIKISL